MLDLETLLLRRVAARHWKLAFGRSLILVLILGMGVAVFVAMRLANRAAVASFAHFTDTLAGQSDWIIQPPAGTLPESILPELRAALGTRPVQVFPVVETTAALPRRAGEVDTFGRTTYTLLGVDLISVASFARGSQGATSYFAAPREAESPEAGPGARSGFWRQFGAGTQVWISRALAEERGAASPLSLIVNDKVLDLKVAGVIPEPSEGPRLPANLIVLDLPQAQLLAGKRGRLDRVEFSVEAGPRREERRAELRELLDRMGLGGARWVVLSPATRRETAETMTRAFRLNLTLLSLMALLVGLYLIFEALDGAVVRRRGEIAILRSLGFEELTVRRAWLAEAALLGIAGGALGVILGWAGSQLAVRAVGRTVNALYYATTVRSAALDPAEGCIGLLLGLGASLCAGWWPAREAARTPAAQVLARHPSAAPGSVLPRQAWLGATLVGCACACAQLPPLHLPGGVRFPLAGYVAALLGISGGGILGGFLLPALAGAGRVARGASAPARIALSHLSSPSGRHRLAVAALLCAVGMTAGMAILVASFESTVRSWVEQALQADLYVSSGGAQSASSQNRISPGTWRELAGLPDVAAAVVLSAYPIQLDGIPTLLTGSDLREIRDHSGLVWVRPPADDAVFDPARSAGLALASESFCERFRKRPGDAVSVPTPSGARMLTLAGIYADYGNERGSLLVERSRLAQWFGDDYAANLSLFLKPGADAAGLAAALRARYPGLAVYTNAALRAEILRIFRQTFSVTYALEVIGVAVAIVGLSLTLTSVLLDRRDELTALRCLGFGRGEIALSTALEGTSVAASAVAAGLALSLGLGWLLIHVINKQSFGWTLGFIVPWGQLAALGCAVVATGGAVSFCVGRWAADLPADREE